MTTTLARAAVAAEVTAARRGTLAAEAPPLGLDGGQRLLVLDHLITAIGSVYAHLPAKRAAYASDPVQALVLLRRTAADLTDAEFHRAVSGIVTGLRDAHTRYLGPSSLRGRVAVLPFLAEQYGPDDAPQYLVSKINSAVVTDDGFRPGVELTSWNGVPFPRAVELHADSETGGRPDSRRARAVESLTFRSLGYGPPPDEAWVIVGYRTADGGTAELRLDWRIVEPGKAGTAVAAGSRAAAKQATDLAAESVRRAKKLMFAPDLWAADQAGTREVRGGPARRAAAAAATPAAPVAARGKDWIPTTLQDVLAARPLDDRVGYLRIWSFDVDNDDTFVNEVVRLLGLLPQTGLIVDLRANPGGLIWAAERSLQLFTDATVQPTRFSLLATPLTRQLADSPFNRLELEAWSPSLQDAVSTGELWAQPLPLTDPAWCRDLGRRYPGPAVAVVDANTYSSGDLFAAGWVDHAIGPLVSVGHATGAGGANVWTSHQLLDALTGTDHDLPPMPAGTGYTLAFRRAIRSAAGDGLPIEDLGVAGLPYAMTRADLLDDNVDLLAFCRSQLASEEE